MTHWTDGYVAEVNYTHGYYPNLNPIRALPLLLANNIQAPKIRTACELGFGQGLSINIHAAASDIEWWGTDFNPSQAGFAQELASASGANLFDQSFADFCQRSDLPEFQFIALHGIWTWISDENRAILVDFFRRKLSVGGIVYISYNTLPGWSTAAPLRHLMSEFQSQIAPGGMGLVTNLENALEFTQKLIDAKPLWIKANPLVAERFSNIKTQDRHYLAHEYLNGHWNPTYFSEMVRSLDSAKLSFACSASATDFIDALNLTADHRNLLAGIGDTNFRQTIRDFITSQQFRTDYWVRGIRTLKAMQAVELIDQQQFVLCLPRASIELKAKGALGEGNLAAAVYNPLLDLMSDYRPRSLRQLVQELAGQTLNRAQIAEAIIVLMGQGSVSPAQSEEATALALSKTKALNRMIMEYAKYGNSISTLACPVTGGGINVDRFQQLFLTALDNNLNKPAEWVQFTWSILSAQNQKILKQGKLLETEEQNLQELTDQANVFANDILPVLKALRVA